MKEEKEVVNRDDLEMIKSRMNKKKQRNICRARTEDTTRIKCNKDIEGEKRMGYIVRD